MTEPRPLPHSVELEQALLGAVLVDNTAYRDVSDILQPQHFFEPLNRTLYEIAAGLIVAGKVANPATIGAHLPAGADKIKVDGRLLTLPKYIARLASEAITTKYARHYADVIVDRARRREIIKTLEEIAAAAYDGAASDILDMARTSFTEIAKSHGHRGIRFTLVPFADLKSDPAAHSYLIKGLLPRQGLIVVWGPPKCGKSFWTFDAVMHVAIGRDYRGHRVRRGEVVYLALEGQAGFADRKEAFCRRFLVPDDTDRTDKAETAPSFHLCGASLDLIHDHENLIADITAQSVTPAAVVIDTLNRSLAGNENDVEDMSAYVRAADAIQRAFDCAVVIIHHCGVNGERPRGHTSLTGAADVQISVRKDAAGIVTATVELAKDMAEGTIFASRLELEEIGTDPDGDRTTSCVVVPVQADNKAPKAEPKAREPASVKQFRAAFTEALDASGQAIVVRAGSPTVRAVEVPTVRAEFDRRYATGDTDTRKRADAQRKAFGRAMEKLASEFSTCVKNDREWIWQSRS
jgi:hypothetical protein